MTPYAIALEDAARRFVNDRSAENRERLCEAAMPMVRRLAGQVLRRLPPHFTSDDLVGDGCVGLLRAIDRFDPDHGTSFEHWASRIVRGAMLNGLRRMDIIPERVRRDARTLETARWRLANATGSAPTDSAAAAGAGLNDSKLSAVLLALRRANHASLDAPLQLYDHTAVTLADRLTSEDDPAEAVADKAVRKGIAAAVATLPKREQHIIASFYCGDTTFRAIGGGLGISKQRVSQIHARSIATLRERLGRRPDA